MANTTMTPSDLYPNEYEHEIVGRSIEGGRSLSGITQALHYGCGGFWRVRFRFQLLTAAQHLEWNRLAAFLSGTVNTVTFPFITTYIEPASISAVVTGDYSAGDATVTLELTAGSLTGGEIFSLNHGGTTGRRCYQITEIDSSDTDTYTVGIAPTLREDVHGATDGLAADFSEPQCRMRLMTGEKMMPYNLINFRRSHPQVTFVEAFV